MHSVPTHSIYRVDGRRIIICNINFYPSWCRHVNLVINRFYKEIISRASPLLPLFINSGEVPPTFFLL